MKQATLIALARVNVHSDGTARTDEAFFAIGNVSGGVPAKQT